jgi:ATP-dependent DNA ligase
MITVETDVQFSESFELDGRKMYKHDCKAGLEGVVSKVRDSRYNSAGANDFLRGRSTAALPTLSMRFLLNLLVR